MKGVVGRWRWRGGGWWGWGRWWWWGEGGGGGSWVMVEGVGRGWEGRRWLGVRGKT